MGLLSFIATLPLAPVRGVISLAEIIARQVDEELYDPANVRRELEELEDAYNRGEITPEELQDKQQIILDRLIAPRPSENTQPGDSTDREEEP